MFKFNRKKDQDGNGQAPADRGDSSPSSGPIVTSPRALPGEGTSFSQERTSARLEVEKEQFPVTGWKSAPWISWDRQDKQYVFFPNAAKATPYGPGLTRFECKGHVFWDRKSNLEYEHHLGYCSTLDEDPKSPCGFYSIKDKEFFLESNYGAMKDNIGSPLALEVDHYGRVVIYEHVIRAEYQRVLSMWIRNCIGSRCNQPPVGLVRNLDDDRAFSAVEGTFDFYLQEAMHRKNPRYGMCLFYCKKHISEFHRVNELTEKFTQREPIFEVVSAEELAQVMEIEVYTGLNRERVR